MSNPNIEGELREIRKCDVCGNDDLISVLDLGLHPICDDLVPLSDTRVCREFPIEIVFCKRCFTAHQRFPIPKEALFPRSYHYRSRFTADVLNGMTKLVESCEERFGSLTGKKVLDIGCNDGSLLDRFAGKGAITIGIEPTDASSDARDKGHEVYSEYLSESVATNIVNEHGKPDFITFTNVFAHIDSLQDVLGALRRLVASRTVIVIENHYLGAVLDANQFDTFYHEHCRTYSYTSFRHVADSLGMTLLAVEFPSRYGGNIRVFLAGADGGNEARARDHGVQGKEARFLERFEKLRANVDIWRTVKTSRLQEQVARFGKLRAKAFPARAAIIVKLLGLDEQSVAAVHEKPGSLKIGHYVPGTRIPICSDDELFSLPDRDGNGPLLNLAWHIPREIRNYLAERGYTGPVMDAVAPEDFQSQ
jgi:SAM-dependent methyltransferase